MSFKRNDIVSKQRLRDALEEETAMGFAHNDIVTTYAMDEAIAEGGGGGGGDFSTAQVTITNIGSGSVTFGEFAIIDEDEDYLSCDRITLPAGRSVSLDVVLYKSRTSIWTDDGSIQSVTGNATLDDGAAFVSGNCTITVTNA